jgi:hypothetical protein
MDEPKLVPCPECGGTGKVPLHLDNLPGPSPPSRSTVLLAVEQG